MLDSRLSSKGEPDGLSRSSCTDTRGWSNGSAKKVGTSSWHTVRQEDIDLFAKLTGDEQWIHIDPARAADGPFGTTVQHGFLTLGLATGLLW